MSGTVFTYDVCLSHNQADKPRVRRLAVFGVHPSGARQFAAAHPKPSLFHVALIHPWA